MVKLIPATSNTTSAITVHSTILPSFFILHLFSQPKWFLLQTG
jgi:hypothetical protein